MFRVAELNLNDEQERQHKCLILKTYVKKLTPSHVTAMSRLDHNRTIGQLAEQLQVTPGAMKNVFVLGNHSIEWCQLCATLHAMAKWQMIWLTQSTQSK
uniref:Malate dehydrogenase n=1 Tax=Trepomonas sp. PC1 TaxID=1076344 RepID=A0A146KA58_9EUKA|eukprot:JAP92615.1 Malate dehydrogenase [Trepomonas sp. PC1]